MQDGREMVANVREAAARHRVVWGVLVPSVHEINADAEPAEEAAYQELATAKRRLRDHIRETYGITAAELCSLSSA